MRSNDHHNWAHQPPAIDHGEGVGSMDTVALLLVLSLGAFLVIGVVLGLQRRTVIETQEVSKRTQEANKEPRSEVTERQRADEATRASEARFAGILDIAREAVISVDDRQRIRLFNRSAVAIFGYSADEVLGQPLEMLMPPRFREGHPKKIGDFARASEVNRLMHERGEIVGLRKDGTEFPVEASVSKLVQGKDTIFTAMLNDITERKQAEEDLRVREELLQQRVLELTVARDELEQQGSELVALAESLHTARSEAEVANRSKSEFLANMSHELRTPLNAIIGFSEIIKNETFGPVGSTQYREYGGDIHEAGQHLLDLINDILDLSKIEAGGEEMHEGVIEILEIVNSVVTLVKGRAQKGDVRLELDMPDDLPMLYADERKIKQILVNILSNAIKFTKAGGSVTLTIWYRPGSGYVFQTTDTGVGMAIEDIPKALMPFGQIDSGLNRNYEGTGLGLPLTKHLVEMHSGSLDLQSAKGVGTTVTVRLPAERIMIAETTIQANSA